MQDYITCIGYLIEKPENVFDIGSRDGDDANILGSAFNIPHENIYTFECNNTNYNYLVSGSLNKSSTLHPRVLEIFNASTVDGTYIPFSIALILFLETSALSDNSC